MARTRRHALEFDSLEGKLLLSTGMADPAATVHQQKAIRFHLNGMLSRTPIRHSRPNGFIDSSFPLNGHVASMGTVEGAFFLKYSYSPVENCPTSAKPRWC